MSLIVSLLLLCSVSFAQQSDQQLIQYIRMMNIRGLPQAPAKNEALYQLGLRLFYDKQLSGKGNISCGSCHSLQGFSADTLPLGVGEGAEGLGYKRYQHQGTLLARHTPALYNAGLPGVASFFWDGRVMMHPQGGWWTPEPALNGPNPQLRDIAVTLNSLLSTQALFPMANPAEMLGVGSPLSPVEAWQSIMHRLFNGRMGASYQRFFREAYPGVVNFNIGHAANAIAELERHHFLANNTPWDMYARGDRRFMTERMKKGAVVFFGKARCANCHSGEHFSSFGFQNIGTPQVGPGVSGGDDKGLMEFTKVESHKYRFRVTPLRNAALTPPYMHSGVFTNMWQVIEHYNNPALSLQRFTWNPRHPRIREDIRLDNRQDRIIEKLRTLAPNLPRNIGLTDEEKINLYCFLMVGLTDLKDQRYLLNQGVLDEINDCSPRITQ